MKIFAHIPVERVPSSPGTFRYRYELLELEIVRVLRCRCDRHRERYTYQADVRRTLRIKDEAVSWSSLPGCIRVNIDRRLNPTWKRPATFVNNIHIPDSA